MDVWRKTKPRFLRHPGQSLDEQIDRLINEKFLGFWIFAAVFWLVALLEWTAKLWNRPRLPGVYALAACCFTAVAAYQFVKIRRRVAALKQGRDGEREVAELLDELKESGAQVIHDVPAEDFNIDHVVISSRGIYAIETKKWTKSKERSLIEFDGQHITIAGKRSQYDPVRQCRAQTSWVQDHMKSLTGKRLPIRGVVVFPGWWVEQSPKARESGIWVLNPKAFGKWIAREPEILELTDVSMAAHCLRQYVRNH